MTLQEYENQINQYHQSAKRLHADPWLFLSILRPHLLLAIDISFDEVSDFSVICPFIR